MVFSLGIDALQLILRINSANIGTPMVRDRNESSVKPIKRTPHVTAPRGGMWVSEAAYVRAAKSMHEAGLALQYVGGEMTHTTTASSFAGLNQRNGSRTMRKLSPACRWNSFLPIQRSRLPFRM